MGIFKRFVTFSLKVFLATIIVSITLGGSIIVFFVIFGIILGQAASSLESAQGSRKVLYGKEDAPYKFASIPIHGVIVGDTSDISDPFGLMSNSLAYGYDVKKKLRELAQNKDIHGVVLSINSPGGTIYGSKAIADGVAEYKRISGKPVISFISGIAASGGYWVAVSGDSVFADAGTSIGSIGVISGPYQFYDKVIAQDGGILDGGVVTQNGIETTFITAGKYKDLGNPFRKLTKEELATMQTMVNNEYDGFLEYVSSRRNINKGTLRDSIGALVYDTKMSKEKNLIDAVMNKEDAYKELAKRANISEDAFSIVEESPNKGFFKSLLESRLATIAFREQFSSPLCQLTTMRLVYHGDVAAFCK